MSLGPPAVLVLAAALAGCAREELLHGLDERQASEVLVALDERGVAASKLREDGAEERWRVEVERGEATRAHRILAERDLPRARAPGVSELFGKGSMVPTPTEEHALLPPCALGRARPQRRGGGRRRRGARPPRACGSRTRSVRPSAPRRAPPSSSSAARPRAPPCNPSSPGSAP